MRTVSTPSGRWRGRQDEGAVVFHGIHYARADRFAPPRRAPAATGVTDAIAPGPVAPQLPSRLEAVMGPAAPLPQSEDCLTVTVTVPDRDTDEGAGPAAVLVWLHGGAFLSGSGEWNLYDATRLVHETGIVVVSVGYRLGVLGYLRAPGMAPGNLGLLDQIAALEWVRENIAAFGGDPGRVTVAGQSAGAHSVAALLGIGRARPLFTRAILHSAPLGLGFHTHRRALRAARPFLAALSGDPRTAPVADVLAAQARAARTLAGPAGLNSAPPYLPVEAIHPLPAAGRWRRDVVRHAPGLQVLIGTTADEAAAFHHPHPFFTRLRRLPVPGPQAAAALSGLVQRKTFDRPARAFADLLAGAGAEVWRFRFGPLHPDNPFGACHCIELPLFFGDSAAWRQAPMIRPLTPAEAADAGARTRRYWGEFVRTGRIADPAWPRHRPGSDSPHPLP
ncbi:carboxylesterase family protein [Streptomyces lichenis]|uniref:Carboxylic ester hydrolase n=1 Tax=Streptomyces lichenis TaxID=2306967 RepID=A0ABT0IAU1_9ACTN|nr:carboxylesterase family protein [Streptomyces lichenis]MCK8678441.1 carboxylesterase family protein [Streptomyces lichenis]